MSFFHISPPGVSAAGDISINNEGQILGGGGLSYYFLYTNGAYAELYTPTGSGQFLGLNDDGQVVGDYDSGGVLHGLVDTNGSYTTIDYPGASFTQLTGINASGQIVGNFGGLSNEGFLDNGGSFNQIRDPLEVVDAYQNGTQVQGINNQGQIVGWYVGSGGGAYGFVDTAGGFTTVSDPSAVPGPPSGGSYEGTFVEGINNAGVMVGWYRSAGGQPHGFVDDNGTFTTIDYPGAMSTVLTGINDAGQIVGNYQGSPGYYYGFLMAQPSAGPSTPPASDFNGDGTGDVLFQNDQSGAVTFAVMQGGTFSGFGTATGGLGALAVVGHGDINGDGFSDVVVQDPNSGQVYIAEQNGSGTPTWVLGPDVPGYAVVGVGDINGDGYADLVIQSAGGPIDYYDVKNNDFVAVANTPGFNVVGVGDVNGAHNTNGDGYADIVIQNPSTGQIDYANMTGGVFSGFVPVVDTPNWKVQAVAAIRGNGYDDIIVQDTATAGAALYADMTNGGFNGFGYATGALPAGYVVAGASDVNGDGYADLIVQQMSTGATYYAEEGPFGFVQQDTITTALNSHFHVV